MQRRSQSAVQIVSKLVGRGIQIKMDAKLNMQMLTLDPNAITVLLTMYRKSPCLWDVNDIYYADREARKRAWQAINRKMKGYHKEITLDIVKRKVQNMRTIYKRECRRMSAARDRGEDGCRTTLWYFDLMSFIDGAVVPSKEDEDDDDNDKNQPDNDTEDSYAETEDTPQYIEEEEEDESKSTRKKSRKFNSLSSKRIKKGDTNPTISSVYLTTPDSEETALSETHEAVVFGKAVGLQLKDLDGTQRTIAEKLISDTIFNARLNKLTTNSMVQLNSSDYSHF